ncbi:hypothetical protein LJC09_00115 [Desulfovibrio sp. OttesenSCG-928-F20]|nr:hypothetical protein [Desulfovibrio sp. OttesenSCG-928-F20]
MKGIRLILLCLVCVMLLSGCIYRTKVEGHSSATLIEDWESLVKKRLASLTPLGSPEQVIPLGTPEPCTFDFENRLYGYCGKADIVGGLKKSYFISDTNVVWLIGLNGLSTLP